MEIRFNNDSVEITGYVNAVERDSKPLWGGIGKFIEKIKVGAFKRALARNDDIHILLNHNPNKDLGSTKKGNLKLEEDNIGLRAKATIYDPDVIKEARNGDLVGWSFGFYDMNVTNSVVDGVIHRDVEDLDLREVSIIDRTKVPAYDGTLIEARSEEKEKNLMQRNGIFLNSEEKEDEKRSLESKETINDKENNPIDYSKFDTIIKEMKGEM